MNRIVTKLQSSCYQFRYDPLYSNSIFILLNSICGATIGILFWLFAAKITSAENVGIATVTISALMIIIQLSRLGLDQVIIKNFPIMDKSVVLFSTTFVTTIISIILGFFLIVSVDIWFPNLSFIKENSLLFIVFLIVCSITTMMGFAFVASRQSHYYFIQSILLGTRIIIMPLLIYAEALGIFISFFFAYIIAFIFSGTILLRNGFKKFSFDSSFLRDSIPFSIANYCTGLLLIIPIYLLPIMVFNELGSKITAYFFIGFSIGSITYSIPASISTAIFVEGSYGKNVKNLLFHGISLMIIFLIPVIIVLYFTSDFIFNIIGQDYLYGSNVMLLIAISCIFGGLFQFFIAILKIFKNNRYLIIFSSLTFSLLIFLSYFFLKFFGLNGIGYAWILTYILIDIIALIFILKKYSNSFI